MADTIKASDLALAAESVAGLPADGVREMVARLEAAIMGESKRWEDMGVMAELRVIKRGYKADVVEILENLLTEARDGKITSIVVTTEQGGEYVTDYSGCKDLARLVGHMARQQHLMLRRMDG